MPTYTLNGKTVANTAFQWKDANSNQHATMFSILPTFQSDSGLATSKRIEIVAKVVKFANLRDLEIPTQPSAATDPKTGALSLIASVPAMICLVAASLY